MKRALLLLALVFGAAGCSSPPLTQLIVAVDTDLMAPGDLDRVEVVVTDPEGMAQSRTAVLNGSAALPVTLGVVHRGGPLGPVTVQARGILRSSVIVERRATVTMIEGRTMLLELHLESLCIGVACPGETTCETGECRPVAIDPGELREFDGTIPRYDIDAGSGCLRTEICNGRDDTCDGMIDEGFDFATDPEHCGGCNVACPAFENAAPACTGGECTVDCDEGWGNCDRDARTGCEEDLSSPSMCGECGWVCEAPHGTPACFGSACAVASCAVGYGDCDESPSNGCEMLLNELSDCGACGRLCDLPNAMENCAGGVCTIRECDVGFADCVPGGGCETTLGTVSNCAGCGLSCPAPPNAEPACLGGRCSVGMCDEGWGNCNGMPGDGCERPLDTVTDCGACGFACVLSHASPVCTSAGCDIASCDVGYADCDGNPANGCERSIEDAANCGACGVTCSGGTPVCNRLGTGERMCQSVCGAVLDLCGSSCVDTDESLLHCGACDRPCAPAHATGDCTGGTCGIGTCEPGWGNCDGNPANGCERRLDTVTSCGSCGNVCTIPGASAVCMGGVCAVGTCNAMLDDCDGMSGNGCEQRLDTLDHCGGCGVGCDPPNATGTCSTGTCGVAACDAGFGNCLVGAGDGCETPLDTLLDCGGCGVACDLPHATESCSTGTCRVTACDATWADCNAGAAGCETSITTATDCGSCGVACGPFTHASSSCASGACVAVCDDGWGDCDAATPECETPLDTLTNCGACGTPCSAAGATTTCAGGTCTIASCTDPLTGDCNGSPFDGCEADLRTDDSHCGACGAPCDVTEVCTDGACVPL